MIGNPPYVNVKNGIDKQQKDYYTENYKTAIGQFDLFTLFLEKGFELGRLLSFIVPKPIINNENYSVARNLIFENGLFSVVTGSNIFENAGVESCILMTSKLGQKKKISISEVSDYKILQKHFITTEFSKNLPFSMINTEIKQEVQIIFEKLQKVKLHLSDILDITRGIEGGKSDKCITTNSNEYKLLRGEDLEKYTCSFNSIYCEYDKKDLTKFKPLNLYFQEKIMIRRVANEIIATFDKDNYLVLNTIYCAKSRNNDFDLKFITAILNSKLISFWFKNIFVLTDKLFPYIRKSQLDLIPIPNIPLENQQPIISLVEQILSAKQQNPQANISELESEIDKLVYELYDLTSEEIARMG